MIHVGSKDTEPGAEEGEKRAGAVVLFFDRRGAPALGQPPSAWGGNGRLAVEVTPVLSEGALVAVRITLEEVGPPKNEDGLEQVLIELRTTLEELETTNHELQATVSELEVRVHEISTENRMLHERNEDLQQRRDDDA